MTATAAEGEALASHAPYAGVISRGLAGVIDVMLCGVLSFLGLLFIQVLVSLLNTQPIGDTVISAGTAAAVISVIMIVYFAGAWALAGRTIGEALMGLRVIRPNGHRLGIIRSFVRFLMGFVSFAALGLGYAWMLIDSRRRAWQDLVARTIVVYDFDEHGVHHADAAGAPSP